MTSVEVTNETLPTVSGPITQRLEVLITQASADLRRRWVRESVTMDDAGIEIGVCWELFEADIATGLKSELDRYCTLTPVDRFLEFLRALNMPASSTEDNSLLNELTGPELMLAWVAERVGLLRWWMRQDETCWGATTRENVELAIVELEWVWLASASSRRAGRLH